MTKHNSILLLLLSILTHTILFSNIEKQLQNFYHNKNILVTGGCGFIGSEVTHELVRLGAHVTILDDLSTGNMQNIYDIQDEVVFVNNTITNFEVCLSVTKNIDVIFHLAAFISVPGSVDDPKLCYDINVMGTLNLLEAARINNVTSFILSSSSAIYGQQEGTYHEQMKPQPQSPYGDSKLINELCCKQYAKHYGLHSVILRYFNVFGPKQNPHSQYAAVIAKFSYNMKRNLPITIFGDGTQTRDFVSVYDVAHTNILMPLTNKNKTSGQIFNIASGKSISLLQLIEKLKKQFPNYTAQTLFAPERPGDVKHTCANISKFQKLMAHLYTNSEIKKQRYEKIILSLAEYLCTIN